MPERLKQTQFLNNKGYGWTFLESLTLERLNSLYLNIKNEQ